jgi:DNA-binding transcriptional MerR regulator
VFRIGELARRTGVTPDLLRAWERRYGLFEPVRTGGGFRVYSTEDEQRVREMQSHLAHGLAAAEAARLVLGLRVNGAPSAEELREALLGFDEPTAQRLLDLLLVAPNPEPAVEGLLLPLLHEIGENWHEGTVNVAQEHFATAILRGRLLGLARGWGAGNGPLALLACPSGEAHDVGLIGFGLALRNRGWRIVFLGSDTPLDTVAAEAKRLGAALVVLAVSAAWEGDTGDRGRRRRRVCARAGGRRGGAAGRRRRGRRARRFTPLRALAAGGGSRTRPTRRAGAPSSASP